MSEPEQAPIGVGRVEFHRSIQGLERAIQREANGLVKTGGWIAFSLAFWLLLVWWGAMTGSLRGRP